MTRLLDVLFQTMFGIYRLDQMRELISEQAHIDFENIRQDTGQESVFEEMASWDSELWADIDNDFNLPDVL